MLANVIVHVDITEILRTWSNLTQLRHKANKELLLEPITGRTKHITVQPVTECVDTETLAYWEDSKPAGPSVPPRGMGGGQSGTNAALFSKLALPLRAASVCECVSVCVCVCVCVCVSTCSPLVV